jgi:hypothetical protein
MMLTTADILPIIDQETLISIMLCLMILWLTIEFVDWIR